jgi:plastocyanin
MKSVHYLFSISILLILSQLVFPQTTHDVSVANFSFTPAQLTIKVGDTVKWTNNGGSHSVVADDNSFTSGAVSSSAWVFEHTFNSAGSNPYYCGQHGGPGGVGMSGVITVEAATDVNDKNFSIDQYRLNQNFPNPFNPATIISYYLPKTSQVLLKVYDTIGNEVATLVHKEQSAGSYEINFSATHLSSGIYIYKLQAGSFLDSKEMILIK